MDGKDGMTVRTLAEECELAAGGDRETKILHEKFWQMLGHELTETIVEVGDFESMDCETAEQTMATKSGLWYWIGEEVMIVFRDGQRVGDIVCCRGMMDARIMGQYYEAHGENWE